MSRSDKPDVLGWFGLNRRPVWIVARGLGPLFSVVMFLLCVMALSAAFVMLGHALFDFGLEAPRAGLGTGAVIVALLGAPFVVWRAIVAQKQADVAEQGHITDRINKAVEGLGTEKVVSRVWRNVTYELDGEVRTGFEGRDEDFKLPDGAHKVERGEWKVADRTKPNLEVRIGAIYALERIAQDSDRDHVQIMEILCAYIRQNAPVEGFEPADQPDTDGAVRSDIQTALTVIGRRSEEGIQKEQASSYRLDLRNTDLSYAHFINGNFSGALMVKCRLEACSFRGTGLRGAILNGSLLNFSQFFFADLTGARLDFLIWNRPVASHSSIVAATLKGVSFPGADLTAIMSLGGVAEMNEMMGSKDTKLSPSAKSEKPVDGIMHTNTYRNMEDLSPKRLSDLDQIEASGYKYWFPFDSSDLALEHFRKEMLMGLDLYRWPYIG